MPKHASTIAINFISLTSSNCRPDYVSDGKLTDLSADLQIIADNTTNIAKYTKLFEKVRPDDRHPKSSCGRFPGGRHDISTTIDTEATPFLHLAAKFQYYNESPRAD
jgi:hypothetical protein